MMAREDQDLLAMAPPPGPVGLDLGRSAIKAVEGARRVLLFPLAVRLLQPREVEGVGPGPLPSLQVEERDSLMRIRCLPLTYQGETWWLGEAGEDLGLPGLTPMDVVKADPLTRLFSLGLLAALGREGVVPMVLGLPVGLFRDQAQAIRQLLDRPHTLRVGGRTVRLRPQVLVVPEGLGLLARASIREGGALDEEALRAPTLVLDLGHRTTQISLIRGLRLQEPAVVLPHAVGALVELGLRELIDRPLGTPLGVQTHLRLSWDLFERGQVTVGPLTVTLDAFRQVVAKPLGRLWETLRQEVKRVTAGVLYHRVVAGGGGAGLLDPELQATFGPRMGLLPDRFAQAEGYVQLGRWKQAMGARR